MYVFLDRKLYIQQSINSNGYIYIYWGIFCSTIFHNSDTNFTRLKTSTVLFGISKRVVESSYDIISTIKTI